MTNFALRRGLRIAIYAMLVFSAGTAFFIGERLWSQAGLGELPFWAALLPPLAFTAFVLVYTGDRWLLVRRRNFPIGRAVVQVGFAMLFLALLWQFQVGMMRNADVQRQRIADTAVSDPALLLLLDERPAYRRAGCELIGLRGDPQGAQQIAKLASSDPAPEVRAACAQAIARLAEGTPEPDPTQALQAP